MRQLYIFLLIFLCLAGRAQEKIKVMSYNLLNFGNYTDYCPEADYPIETKAEYLATIVDELQPDIFAACEIGGSDHGSTYTIGYILGNALNSNGISKWTAAQSPSNEYLVNTIFFDKNKFERTSQWLINTPVRGVNMYKLKYKQADDLYLYVIVAHLKAGSGAENAQKRKEMAKSVMDFVAAHTEPGDNVLIMGDFNVYTSNEEAYKLFTAPTDAAYAFYDPINSPGEWSNNGAFRHVHTQSTHSGGDNCFASGGLDDRFDFILMSAAIKDGSNNIKYVDNSYMAAGQDGLHFNQSLLEPQNTTLPDNVINALYNMSDHLPVVADFDFNGSSGITSHTSDPCFYASICNPVGDVLSFQIKAAHTTTTAVDVFSICGQRLLSFNVNAVPGNIYQHNIANLTKGMYIVKFSGNDFTQTVRIVKQ